MSLSKRDVQALNSIINELINVRREIEEARDQISRNYRTVGGENFYAPLTNLSEKLKKTQNNLRKID